GQPLDETEDESADDGLVGHEGSLRQWSESGKGGAPCRMRDSLVFVASNFYSFLISAAVKSLVSACGRLSAPIRQTSKAARSCPHSIISPCRRLPASSA